MRWELEAFAGGTRLTLWHKIDRRFISWGAAGWHICFDVLDRLLAGHPIGRIAGGDAVKSGGWQRLTAEYAKQFGAESPAGGGSRQVVNRGRIMSARHTNVVDFSLDSHPCQHSDTWLYL